MTRGFIGLLTLVLAAGIAALNWATDGFHVVTTEGARALAVARHPRALPDTALVAKDGRMFSLSDYRGKEVLVDFIYTGCPTICGVLGDDFRSLRGRDGSNTGLDLLSISFDMANDDREALDLYAQRFDAKAPRWRIARAARSADLDQLLSAFGVIVTPDGFGGFVHNDAIYLVDTQGRLARILAPDALARYGRGLREAAR